jgi:glutamine amidotransferase
MLATDGVRVVATTWGETLCYRISPDGVLIASEPHDDRGDWIRVDDRRVVIADAYGVDVRALELAPEPILGVPAVGDVLA